jgi:iron complex transport system substrate-binding protein
VLALALSACAAQAPPVQPRSHPTVVSLNPCADAILAEVADPGQLLAISHFSHDPDATTMGLAKARRFAATSGAVEEIVALRPDVVVGDAFVSPATARALDRFGIRLERYAFEPDVATSLAQVRRMAALTGHPERGEALVARIEAALARAAPRPGARPVTAVMWQSGGMVPGSETLIGELLRRTGFEQLSAVRGMRQGEILPLELMLADPPRVIFATGNPLSNEDRGLAHPALAALEGTRAERFDSALLWCGGPNIVRTVERLADVRRSL